MITILGGHLKLVECDYPPSEDALWLASIFPQNATGTLLDVGCGTGVVGLAVCLRCTGISLSMVDINPQMINLAEKNAQLNKVKARFQCADAREIGVKKYDYVLSNPPFYQAELGHHKQDDYLQQAYVNSQQKIHQWIDVCIEAANKGVGFVHHQAQQMYFEGLARDYCIDMYVMKTSNKKPAKRILIWVDKIKPAGLRVYQINAQEPFLRKQVLYQGQGLTRCAPSP